MFKSILKLDAKIFNKSARKSAFSSVVSKSARNFKESTRRKMVESAPSGRIERYLGGAGKGFTRGFRRSAKGQRPAVETSTLINAIDARKTGELSAVVDIKDVRNPRNGESARDYAERLQTKMNRKIMTKQDVDEADKDFQDRANKALISLL